MFTLLLITTTYLALSCNPACESLCQELNGRASCYKSCSCPESPSQSPDPKLKSQLASIIKLKYVCDIKDVENCESSSSNEEEFYDCLERVRCLVYNDGAKLLESIPKALRLAAQPSYISFKDEEKCESCKDEYYADEFYACVYYNCQKRLTEVKGLMKVAKSEECRSCDKKEKAENLCVWQECREDFVNKETLIGESEGKNMTCKDCEQIVFADDYYNCIALYCNRLWSEEDLREVSGGKDSGCALCDRLKDDDGLYRSCVKYSCKSEIVSLLKLDLSSMADNCDNLVGEAYESCTSSASPRPLSALTVFILVAVLTLLIALIVLLFPVLIKLLKHEDPHVYSLLTS